MSRGLGRSPGIVAVLALRVGIGAAALAPGSATAEPSQTPAGPAVAGAPASASAPARPVHVELPAPAGIAMEPAAGRVEAPDPAPDPVRPAAPSELAPGRTLVESRWLRAGGDLVARAATLGPLVRQHGLAGYDAGARALLLAAPETPLLPRARAAVALAPDLPAARAALARALAVEAGEPLHALREALRAVASLDRHFEASLWSRATLLCVLVATLAGGGFAFLGVAALVAGRGAAHDLGDRIALDLPGPARAILVGALAIAPAALGQGALGLVLGCLALVMIAGERSWRAPAGVAAALVALGLGPMLERTGSAIASFDADPVASAAFAVETDAATRFELGTLATHPDDPVAARALAVRARRVRDLAVAAERYERLLARETSDATLLNDAANVRLARGEVDDAIPLYEAALALHPSPVLLFNLAHAYGAVARLDEQDAALGRAQALDPGVVGELTALEATPGEPLSIDLPVPVQTLRARALAGEAGGELSASLRRELAPGVLGAGSTSIALSLLVVGLLASAAGRRFEPTRFCRECGARSCPRCDDPPPGLAVCRDCARIPHRPGDAQASERRSERRAALAGRRRDLARRRRLASALVPGAAGIVARRPWLALAGACAFAGALAASPVGLRPVVDPLAAGDAGRWLLAACALLLAALHALAVSVAWSRGEG